MLKKGICRDDDEEKADLHSKSWATGTKMNYKIDYMQYGSQHSLFVLVKNVKRRLASLQPNLFLA